MSTCAFVYVSWQWGKRQRRWYVSKFKWSYLRQWRLEGRGRVRFWCISYLCFSFVFQYHLEDNYSISEISCEQFKTHFQVSSETWKKPARNTRTPFLYPPQHSLYLLYHSATNICLLLSSLRGQLTFLTVHRYILIV